MTKPNEISPDDDSNEGKLSDENGDSLDSARDSLDDGLGDAMRAAFAAASHPAADFDGSNALPVTEGIGDSRSLPAASHPAQVGPYRLVKKLGEGGMGTVWMAEQEKPVRRQVAIKLIKAGIADSQILARFEAERQALSMMDHPHIAKVLDVGSSEDGSPYFVMELVAGEPITEYCDAKKLSLKERLELFIQACEAVQHAHHKGIIHRDLKPSNILVHVHNEKHTVKVIDFGLAKALDQQAKLTDKTVQTEFGRVMGTLQYMSPEQAQLDAIDIDTRTDVYSLGIILYELLAGSTPIDKESLHKKALLQVLEMVRKETPPLPSNRLSSSFDKLDSISAMRQIQSGKLQQILKGELDWVVMRALEKDRARRYATPIDFAADVRRYLEGDAVVARPPSVSYRLRKFVRKNWVPVGIVAGLFALVTGGAIAINTARAKAEESAYRERIAATKSNVVAQLLKDALSGVGPSVALGRDTTLLKEILDRTGKRVNEELDDQPEVEADLRSTLADTYWEIGDYELAEFHQRRVRETYDQLHKGDHVNKAFAYARLGQILHSQGKLDSSERLFREALAMQNRQGSATKGDHKATTLKNIGSLLTQKNEVEEARKMLNLAYDSYVSCYGTEEHAQVATAITAIGNLERQAGNYEEAKRRYERVLAIHRKLLPPEHPYILNDMVNLAGLLTVMHKFDQAEQLLEETIDLQRKVVGRHPHLAESLLNLGQLFKSTNRFDRAQESLEESLEIAREHYSDDHTTVQVILTQLAHVYDASKQYEHAFAIYQQQLEDRLARGVSGAGLASVYNNLAFVHLNQKQLDEAEMMFRKAIELQEDYAPDGPDLASCMQNLGRCLRKAGRFDEAITLFEKVIVIRTRLGRNFEAHVASALSDLGECCISLKHFERAEESLRQALAKFVSTMGSEHLATTGCRQRLATALKNRNKLKEAEQLYVQSREIFASKLGATARPTLMYRAHHGDTLARLGRWEEARTELEFALNAKSSDGNLILEGRLLTKVKIWLGLVLAELKEFRLSETLLLAAEKSVSIDGEPWDEDDAPSPADAIVQLYQEWHQAEPDAGYDTKADRWRNTD